MANRPPINDTSLRSYGTRIPAPPNRLPSGNYSDSVISAALIDAPVDGAPVAAVAVDTTGAQKIIGAVLFTSDAICWGSVFGYAAATNPLPGQCFHTNGLVGSPLNILPWAIGPNIVIDPTITYAAGQQQRYTVNGVADVTGYGTQISPDASLGTAASFHYDLICQSGVIYGWCEQEGQDGFNVQSVILPAASYTEEIRDAGNVLSTDPLTVNRVVGVYEVAAIV